ADGKCPTDPTDPTDKPLHLPPGTETGVNKPGIAIVLAPVNLAAEVKSVRTKKPCWTTPKMCPSRNCVVVTSPKSYPCLKFKNQQQCRQFYRACDKD
ncbi:hypothetical protein pipiens_018366, partial [Culex pipiens pipiens]